MTKNSINMIMVIDKLDENKTTTEGRIRVSSMSKIRKMTAIKKN